MLMSFLGCLYLALTRIYGPGRAALCLLNLGSVGFAGLFAFAAWQCGRDGDLRSASAATLVGLLILAGALLAALLVFQPPV